MMCFGITGPIGHGKSELAKAIVRYVASIGRHAAIVSFATPVKRLAKDGFGWDGKKDKAGRRLLQVIGTDAGREYNSNIWVLKWCDQVRSTSYQGAAIVADDVRFNNEAQMIRRMGGWLIHVRRKGAPIEGGHVSEGGTEPLLVDRRLVIAETPEIETAMFDLARQLVLKYILDKGLLVVSQEQPPKE